ncbi:MAG: hypothetical protein LBD94_00760, partial [Rickettsiales bacterium]|nr:hypothetical protein [Rickettsiales bacterium]
MKKKSLLFFICYLLFAPTARAVDIATDVADPLYIEKLGDFTSETSLDVGRFFQVREIVGYGFSNRFSVAADIRYKVDSDNNTNGFSSLGIRGIYRVGQGGTGTTDILVGLGFGGQGIVPDYSDEVYGVGVRTGKQWNGMTLSATVMTNWIFDKVAGMAYIDLTPEVYFRIRGDWSFGLGATLRKATSTNFDQEWLNARLGTTVGYTGWFMNVGYEVESKDFRIG